MRPAGQVRKRWWKAVSGAMVMLAGRLRKRRGKAVGGAMVGLVGRARKRWWKAVVGAMVMLAGREGQGRREVVAKAKGEEQKGVKGRAGTAAASAMGVISTADIDIGPDFRMALDHIEREGQSAFITGVAGTGKSTLLQYFQETTDRAVVVLAPTGIAAINVHGQTIHSFFRFPPRLIEPAELSRSRNSGVYEHLETLVIDEISMVRADLMDGIDKALRVNRGREGEPFGGAQVVMFGDMHQLPPVVADDGLGEYMRDLYGGIYFFHAPAVKQARPVVIELRERYRHSDPQFISILDAIRDNQMDELALDELNQQVTEEMRPGDMEGYVTLTPTNAAANDINSAMLEDLGGREYEYSATVSGSFGERAFPTDTRLRLRVGARVMTLKNDPAGRWVNGTLATVARLTDRRVWITTDEGEHELKRAEWEKTSYEYDAVTGRIEQKVTGTFTQYPIRLAWALTIHKSQGQTFDRVFIDFGRGTFAHGQAYVALSRCRTLEGVRLGRAVRPSDILLDPAALEFGEAFS